MKRSELVKLLKHNGCYFAYNGKKHEVWHSNITGKDFLLWRHAKEIPSGTLQKILKEAGIK